MAHFLGRAQGTRGTWGSRCGSRKSGLVTEALSWHGNVRVRLYYDKAIDRDVAEVKYFSQFGQEAKRNHFVMGTRPQWFGSDAAFGRWKRAQVAAMAKHRETEKAAKRKARRNAAVVAAEKQWKEVTASE